MRTIPLGIVTCGITLLFATGCSRSADYYIGQGLQSVASRNDAAAILNFRKAIQQDPRSGQGHLQLGLALERKQDFEGAFQEFRTSMDLLPDKDEPAIRFADLCLNLYSAEQSRSGASNNRLSGLYTQIVNIADKILARNPRSFDGVRLKASIAMVNKQYEQAIPLFRTANEIKPLQPRVILPLARCMIETNQPQEAERLALDLIAKDKTAEPAYDFLYMFYEKEKRPAEAEQMLKSKVENNPDSDGAWLQLAGYYGHSQRTPEMRLALQRLLDRPKQFPQAHMQVGDVYHSLDDTASALAHYQEGLKTASDDRLSYQKRIIDALMKLDRRGEAASMIEIALKENPSDDLLKNANADVLLSTGKPAEIRQAFAIYQELLNGHEGDPVRRLRLGRAAMLNGDLNTANTHLLEAYRRLPSSVPIRILLADISLRRKNYSEALQYANEILRDQPQNLGAHLVRSGSMMALGQFKEARKELEVTLAAEPKSIDAQLRLGSLNVLEGRTKEAEDIFRKSYQSAPADVRSLEGLVTAQMQQRQLDGALQLLNQELAKNPDSVALQSLLARTALRGGNTDLAIEHFGRLVAKNPRAIDAYLQLAEAYRSKGRNQDALAQLDKARQLAPSDARIQVSAAAVEGLLGHKEAARESLQKAIALDPSNPFIMNNLAYFIVETSGDPARAQDLIQQALKQHPQQPDFRDTLGSIYQKRGWNDQARQIFKELVDRYPNNPAFRYHLAVTLAKAGEQTKAREALTAALSQKPSTHLDSEIRQLLATLK